MQLSKTTKIKIYQQINQYGNELLYVFSKISHLVRNDL